MHSCIGKTVSEHYSEQCFTMFIIEAIDLNGIKDNNYVPHEKSTLLRLFVAFVSVSWSYS